MEVSNYAATNQRSTREIMLMVQGETREKKIQWEIAGLQGFYEAEVLQSFLHDVSQTFNSTENTEWFTEKISQNDRGYLRDLRAIIESECSPYRQQCHEQLTREYPSVMSELSRVLTCYCSETEYYRSRQNEATFPLSRNVIGRVGLLRGYGNAIVPQVAAEFIRAFEECTQTVGD